MAQRDTRHSDHAEGRMRVIVICGVIVTTLVLAHLSLHDGALNAQATRIISALVSVALCLHAGACAVSGWRALRAGAILAAAIWLSSALVQALLALLALSLAFTIE